MSSNTPHEAKLTDKVTRFIAEKIWKDFPESPRRDGRIVWEFGIVQAIVDVALHSGEAPEVSRALVDRYRVKEPDVTYWLMNEAAKMAKRLTNKQPALLLLMLGIEQEPRNPRFTYHGGLENAAAEIYRVPSDEFKRKFERAARTLKRIGEENQAASENRRRSIQGSGRFSSAFPDVASRYPGIFRRLEQLAVDQRALTAQPRSLPLGLK